MSSSRRVRIARSQGVIALLSAAWMTTFLLLDPRVPVWVVWVAVPVCAAGMLVFRHSAIAGSVLVVAAAALCAVSGTGYGEIEMFLPTMYLLALLGRHVASIITGMVTLVALCALAAIRPDAPWYGMPISVLVYGSAWLFGRIVRRRALVAAAAAREATLLASIDLEQVLADWSLTSRRRAADASLSIVRDAVERMRVLAVGAARTGPPYAFADVDAIRREGERAIGRLHDTLTLLDGGPLIEPDGDPGPDAAAEATSDPSAPSGAPETGPTPLMPERSLVDHPVLRAGATAVMLGLSVIVWLLYGNQDIGLLIAMIALPICAGIGRVVPVVAGLVASVAFVAAAWHADYPPTALLPLGLCMAVLSWDLVLAQRPATRITMTVAFVAALYLGAQFGHRGIGFVCVIVALAVVAAAEWSLRDDILHTELARAAGLAAGIALARVRADRAERVQLARELHDGVSHGITAMTIQASAAHKVGDVTRARRSMELALQIGEQTLREIDALDAGRAGHDLGHDLSALVDGARATGLGVDYRSDGRPDVLSYRIVQEALTNISRYAPGSRVVIEAGQRGDLRFVRVSDSGAAHRREVRAGEPGDVLQRLGQGRGLRGIAARVAERQGRFRAGPRSGRLGGFELYAEWPRATADGSGRAAPALREARET